MKTARPLPRPLMGHYVGLTLEALDRYHVTIEPLSRGLENGTLRLVWTCPELPPPNYCGPGGNIDRDTTAGQWAERMVCALAREAGRLAAEGMDITQSDCWWLVAKIRAGALQLVAIDTLQGIHARALVEA